MGLGLEMMMGLVKVRLEVGGSVVEADVGGDVGRDVDEMGEVTAMVHSAQWVSFHGDWNRPNGAGITVDFLGHMKAGRLEAMSPDRDPIH